MQALVEQRISGPDSPPKVTLRLAMDQIPGLEPERTWPLDARMAMFVLEAAGTTPETIRGRALSRRPCRMIGTLGADAPRDPVETTIYVRDFSSGHLGFIAQGDLRDLPSDKTVWLNCTTDAGRSFRAPCRVGRIRSFMSGWNEGVLHLCAA